MKAYLTFIRKINDDIHMLGLKNPDNISIKENGIRDYINPRWYNAVQPIVATTNFTIPYPDPWADGNGVYFWNSE